jgi:hypothetical protein
MKKAYSIYAALIITIITFLSCSHGSDTPETLLTLNPTLAEFANNESSNSSFSAGDAMGICILPSNSSSKIPQPSDKVYNKKYSYQDNSWSTIGVSEWPDIKDGQRCCIFAYAPYKETINNFSSYSFSCNADQSTTDNFHRSDFIYGTKVTEKTGQAVDITMNHCFAVVTINVKYGTNIDDILSGLTFNAKNNAMINLSNGEVVITNYNADIIMLPLSTPSNGYSKSYSCIIPAQVIDNKTCITLKYKDGTTTNVAISQSIEKAKHYSIGLSVIGKKQVVINGISVSAWDSQATITGGSVEASTHYQTGDVITYMKNRTTNPVTIVVISEGFTDKQLTYGGLFEEKAKSAMDFFFNVEPFKTYKDYFNVYFLTAVSNEQGADSIATDAKHPAHLHDTYFDANWEWDGNYSMNANDDSVFNFVTRYCPDIKSGNTTIDKVAVIMLINDARYGGITHIYSIGRAYAMCPLTSGSLTWAGKNPATTGYSTGDWRNTLIHESGGHCFAKLADEYWYSNETYPYSSIGTQTWPVPLGLNITCDTTSTNKLFGWRSMIGTGVGKFKKEGKYEGADGYAKGLWRPEIISCMIDNRRYYNAWSRCLIVQRILNLAGETYTYDNFLKKDVNYDEILDSSSGSVMRKKLFSTGSSIKISPPLPHPVLHK